MLYKLSTQCKCYMGTEQTHRPRSCSRKHFNAESNLLDVLGKSSFHTALKNALSLPLHCPVGKLTHLLVLSPYTQGMVNVLNKRDTYADILELLWEYLPLMSLPLTTLLVSENRSIPLCLISPQDFCCSAHYLQRKQAHSYPIYRLVLFLFLERCSNASLLIKSSPSS